MTFRDIDSEFCWQPNETGDINFDNAEKLSTSGTTCDTFLLTLNHKRYFVKRLKEEFRKNEVYLTALRKEYEIGLSLHHSSIPTYRAIGKDYIVTDYIEGDTLSRMIQNQDSWLSKKENVRKLITSLLQAVEYLHTRNIVHCDIKTDNIIITFSTRNVMLVDFDKCYTPVMNSTSGNPALFGLDKKDTGSRDIDYHALGILLENLKDNIPGFPAWHYRKFIKECRKKGVDIADLNKTLNNKKIIPSLIGIIAAAVAAFIVFLGIYIPFTNRVDIKGDAIISSAESDSASGLDSHSGEPSDVRNDGQQNPTHDVSKTIQKKIKESESNSKSNNSGQTPLPSTDESSETENIIKKNFGAMQTYIIIGESAITTADKIPETKLKEKADLISNVFNSIYMETTEDLKAHNPEMNFQRIKEAIDSSPFYQTVKKRTDKIVNKLLQKT